MSSCARAMAAPLAPLLRCPGCAEPHARLDAYAEHEGAIFDILSSFDEAPH